MPGPPLTDKRGMRHLTRILPIALLCLGVPATAAARLRTVAPPGDSGISQYAEVVPTAAGATPPRGGGGGAVGGKGSALTASQRGHLNALGPDGRALAAVVYATAPQALGVPVPSRAATRSATGVGRAGGSGGGSTGSPGASGSPAASAALPSSSRSSPVSMLLGAAAGDGGGGLGIWLPGFMLVSALGVGVLAVRRRRAAP